ncbi:MAG: hypothetical protein ACRD4G_09820, partial [Bryobacteraceae bacterium]
VEVNELIRNSGRLTAVDLDAVFKEIAARNVIAQVIHKLRMQENDVLPPVAKALSLAICRNANLCPREEGPLSLGGTWAQAAILVSRLLRNLQSGGARDGVAEDVATQTTPLPFLLEYFRWISHDVTKKEEDNLISDATERRIGQRITHKIAEAAAAAPLYRKFGHDAPYMYWFWAEYENKPTVDASLRETFKENPADVDAFLATYVREGQSLESGLRVPGWFRRDTYDYLAKVVEPQVVADNLLNRYGNSLNGNELEPGLDESNAKSIAQKFLRIHFAVQQERQARQGEGGADGVEAQPPT